jgi:hypothetical protein
LSSSSTRRAKAQREKLQRKVEREPLILEFDYHPNALQSLGPIINTNIMIPHPTRRPSPETADLFHRRSGAGF